MSAGHFQPIAGAGRSDKGMLIEKPLPLVKSGPGRSGSKIKLKRGAGAAFTLMEMMLALVVSSIVLAGIGGVFYSAIRLRDRTTAMLDESMPLHQAFGFLRRDLQGTLPPGGAYSLAGDFKAEQLGGGIGQNYRLQFFASTGVLEQNTPWGDVQQVTYELRDSTTPTNGSGRELVRSLYRNLLTTAIQEPSEQVLLNNVQSLEFGCYDGYNWRESWDTSLGDTNLPSAIRIRIRLAAQANADVQAQEPFELVVPVVIQSRTNQTQIASP